MIGNAQKILGFLKSLRSRIFAVSALAAATALTVSCADSMIHVVLIRDGIEAQTVYTTKETPDAILDDFGYETEPYDEISFTGIREGEGEIRITRAFPVEVRADGNVSVIMTTGGDVGDLLEEADVELGRLDNVDIPLTSPVGEGGVITVTRNELLTHEEEVELPCETVAIPTSLLAPGAEHVLAEGKNGVQLETYQTLVVNGAEKEPKLLNLDVVVEPVDRRVLVGEIAAPVSQLDFGFEFDQNGEPIGYSRVLRGQRAAGYSARAGARTASGREAVVGHVAINPCAISYGSKLYIRSTDGSFVYGYAVAADTGTAITQGIIDVDLFYGTYAESALNGIKSVDIFILEE